MVNFAGIGGNFQPESAESSHKSLYWYPEMFGDYLTSDDSQNVDRIDEIVIKTIDTALPVLLSFMSYLTFFKLAEFTPNKFKHYYLFSEESNTQIILEQFNSRELKIKFWNDFKESKKHFKGGHNGKEPKP